VSGQLKSIVEQRSIRTLYAVFLCKELPFGVAMIAPALNFSGFLIAINSLTHALI